MPASRLKRSPEDFIRERLLLAPLSFRPDLALYRPTPKSGLIGWLAEQGRADAPPYWAYAWAGGAALAVYLHEHPETVDGKTVLDFGAGGGLVAIAAAKAGAAVKAFEPDPLGRATIGLNAAANGVKIDIGSAVDGFEIVLAGDVFYDPEVAAITLPALTALAQAGATVFIGDPYRKPLPLQRLQRLARYRVPDFGSDALVDAGVFRLVP